MEQLESDWTTFHEIINLSVFQKYVEKIQDSFKSDKNNGYLDEHQYAFLIMSRSVFLRMRNISDAVEKIKTYSSYLITFFFKNHAFMRLF